MGEELAQAHNRLASIADEESVVKAKFKERKATIEQSIGSLSLDLSNGWTMQNVECSVHYAEPNPLEVTYRRIDTGAVVKTRAMTADERQQELPLEPPTEAAAEASAEQSAANVVEFFRPQDRTATDQPEPIEDAAPDMATPNEPAWPGASAGGDVEVVDPADNPYVDASVIQEPAPSLFSEQTRAEIEAMPKSGIDNPGPLFDLNESDQEPPAGVPASNNLDDLFPQAVRIVVESQKVSASTLQRELGIGYARAAQLINMMESNGVVGPASASVTGSRDVLKDQAWLDDVLVSQRHPADDVIAPKDANAGLSTADEHKARVAKTFKPKALRESGFKGEEPKIPETW
jgi:hypothetical protein